MSQVANRSSVPVSLATGRVLAPGERADVTVTDEEASLIRAGLLREIPDGATRRPRKSQDAPASPRASEGSDA